MKLIYFSILVSLTFSNFCQAAFEFDKLFQPGMVIQQNKPIFFFGKESQKDAEIIIAFGNKKSKKFKPNADGTWMVEFKPMRADKDKYNLVASIKYKGSKAERREIKNIAIGDVWLIAGQQKSRIANMPTIKDSLKDLNQQNLFMTAVKFQLKDKPVKQLEYQPEFRTKWQIAKAEDDFYRLSPFAYYFGQDLASRTKSFIGTIQCPSSGPICSWLPEAALDKVGIKKQIFKEKNSDLKSTSTSSSFNGMINPLSRFNYRGVVFINGLSGDNAPPKYAEKLTALIESWRQVFKDPSLHFIILQPFASQGPQGDTSNEALAWIRDAQSAVNLKVPGTNLVVNTDCGLAVNQKTANFPLTAKRAAFWAANMDKKTRLTQPLKKKIVAHPKGGGKINIEFNKNLIAKDMTYDFDKSQLSKSKPSGFYMAGADQVFHPAEALIKGNNVTVWSSKVPKPRAIRYGWSNLPKANVYSTDGLPLVPFRTDSFPPPAFDGSVTGIEVSMQTATGVTMNLSSGKGIENKAIADGKGLIVTATDSKGLRKIYAKTKNPNFTHAKTKNVDVTLVYFDGYKGQIKVFCDTSSYVPKSPKANAKIKMTGSQKWLYTTFSIKNTIFKKRIFGNDILLKSENSDFVIGGIYVRPSETSAK